MGDCNWVTAELEEEQYLIAAVEHLVKALQSKRNLTDDAKKILADLGAQLSTLTIVSEHTDEGMSEIEARLIVIREQIISWDSEQSIIWDLGPEEAAKYLEATDEARKLAEKLETIFLDKDDAEKELLRRAQDVLQMAMSSLEEEFRHILVENRQPIEPLVSFRSSEEEIIEVGSLISDHGDDPIEDSVARDSVSRTWEEFIIDLVHPDVISYLNRLANLMFVSRYGQECSQAYIGIRRDALDECLSMLGMEKLSIEDVLQLKWSSLSSKIKRWVQAMKIFVRVYLASEKFLSEQIFGDLETVNSACFAEASKASMMQLLNFAEAVTIAPHKPEKLFSILDMHEVLAGLLPDIDSMYSDEAGSQVKANSHEILTRLGDSARAVFLHFENAIAANISTSPFAGGGVHHLTKYVMNYLNLLKEYHRTLNFLLQDCHGAHLISLLNPDTSPCSEAGNRGCNYDDVCPVALHFRSVASVVECKLDEKAKLYKDASLQHIFMMNNIHYMAQKVETSELRFIFGEEWIRKWSKKFQNHELLYQRATWCSILDPLKENSNSKSASKSLLKERFRNFYLAFEEIYRTQTAWLIPDTRLREDLQTSASIKVIQAYRTFVGRHSNDISDKHIKYSDDDLQNCLLDLFGGSQKCMANPNKR